MIKTFGSYKFKKIRYFMICIFITLFISCSEKDDNDNFNVIKTKFYSLHDQVLGYDHWGQRDTWMDTYNLLTVYSDAMIFKSNDSIDIGYVGFGYGHHDLSKYYTLDTNIYSYSLKNNIIEIYGNDSIVSEWRIDEITDTSIVIDQILNDQSFSFFLKFENK